MARASRKHKVTPENEPQDQGNSSESTEDKIMDDTYTPEVVEALTDTAEVVEALVAEPTEEPSVDVPVDIETLTPEQRLAVLEKLLTAQREQRAQEKAERAARRAQRDSGQSERVAQDAKMLTDIGTRLLELEPTVTACDPRGFRRYTGTVVINGQELRITATAHEARKRGRPRRAEVAENGAAEASEAPEESAPEYADETAYDGEPDYSADNV